MLNNYSLNYKKPNLAILLTVVFFTCLVKIYTSVLFANLDLTDTARALFMDERVLYDGVYRILHPENLDEFLFSTIDANTHLYGRIFWNINAIVGFLPDYLFGSKGLILSERVSSVLFLSSSYIFFSITFLKGWFFRVFLFFLLVNAPFSSYFMTMPKPEPVQMFFLSLFFYFSKKNQFALEKKQWVFLGLSIGTKISILPLSVPMIVFSMYRSFSALGLKKTIEETPKMVMCILLGISISVPILLKHFLVSFLVFWLGTKVFKVQKRVRIINKLLLVFTFLIGNGFYSFICKKFFATKTGLYKWFTQTILNTGHGSDVADVGFFSWTVYFLKEFLSPSVFINIFLIILSFSLVFTYLKKNRTLSVLQVRTEKAFSPIIFLFSGLILLLVIFSTANRIWGFYLVPGFSLIVLSLVSTCEIMLTDKHYRSARVLFKKLNQQRVPLAFVLSLLVVCLFFWFPQNLRTYKELANRTNTEEYKVNFKSYNQIKEALVSLSKEKNRKVHVKNIGSPFVPENCDYFSILGLERPFTQWWAGYEILLVKGLREVPIKDINTNLLNYDFRISEKKSYNKQVVEINDPCQFYPCYKRTRVFENGTELLVLYEKSNTNRGKK